jgi:hypothetical protein
MTRGRMTRRTMREGAIAIGALVAASGELSRGRGCRKSAANVGAPLPPAPARLGEHAVCRMDHRPHTAAIASISKRKLGCASPRRMQRVLPGG